MKLFHDELAASKDRVADHTELKLNDLTSEHIQTLVQDVTASSTPFAISSLTEIVAVITTTK